MNNKAKKIVKDFYLSVIWYLKKEYKPKYYRYCESHMNTMYEKVSPLYWGGSNISNTAAELVEYIKKASV